MTSDPQPTLLVTWLQILSGELYPYVMTTIWLPITGVMSWIGIVKIKKLQMMNDWKKLVVFIGVIFACMSLAFALLVIIVMIPIPDEWVTDALKEKGLWDP